MTHHDQLLATLLKEQIGEASPDLAIEKLLQKGLINRAACERLAIHDYILRQEKEGARRCEAMILAAEKFCCSYEKARDSFYYTIKHQLS